MRPRTFRRPRRDDGFTLIEVLVSIVMISMVTSGLTMFFIQSRASIQVQSQFQQAAQMASGVMERVSLLPGTSLVSGRPASCVSDQWSPASTSTTATPPAKVQTYFTYLTQLYDVSLPTQTVSPATCTSNAQLATETLPTQQITQLTVNGHSLAFNQYIYIGTCGQQVDSSGVPTGTCLKTGGLSTLR